MMIRASWAVAAGLALQGCGGETGSTDSPIAIVNSYEVDGARLDASLDRSSLTTAETAVLRLVVESAETDRVEFPPSEDGFGEFAVVRDVALPDRLVDGGLVVRSREYVLQPFLPGDYELPTLTVTLNGSEEIVTNAIQITVESVIEEAEAAELKDIAEPVDIPVPWWWWALGIVGLAVAAGGLLWWWRRRKLKAAEPRVVPHHEAALAALEALLAEELLQRGEIDAFYARLSGIVRHYVEDRFGLRAPEQTTEEFLGQMSSEPLISSQHQRLLREFLQRADMVKFAKFVPGRDETGGSVGAARAFIEQTVPVELLQAGQK